MLPNPRAKKLSNTESQEAQTKKSPNKNLLCLVKGSEKVELSRSENF